MVSSVVRLFISSPSDVREERARAERVAERLSGIFDGLRLETYRWEQGRYFSAHEAFQPQIPPVETFDIVVGLFWSRLGTPLPASFPSMPDGRPYASGTAFEILKAIEHRQAGGALPDVFVYRKTAPPPVSITDREKRATQMAALDALDAFVSEWFVSEAEGLKAAFKSFETTDQFEALFEMHLRAWLRDNRRLGRERRWRVEEQGSPFRGLEPFDAGHREVFFGRGADVERARERLEDRAGAGCAFLLIEGASGTGKSSLARAGLLPRLQDLDLDLRSATMRPGTAPLGELAASLYAPGALPELAKGDFPSPGDLAAHLEAGGGLQPLLRALERAGEAVRQKDGREQAPRLRVVLLVDQLEELFGQGVAVREREVFAGTLAGLARSGRILVVATLRADAHAAALAEPTLARLLDEGAALALGPPGVAELAEIVRAPAEAAALAFERRADGVGLDEVLIKEAGGPEALPLLQFALDELYRRAVARVVAAGRRLGEVAADEPVATLSFEDYAALGGLEGAVRSQAEAAYAAVSPAAQGALPRLVRALTDLGPQGTTVLRAAPASEAAPDGPGQELLEALARARILVREEAVVRFSHEAVLRSWARAAQAAQEAASFLRVRADVTRMEGRWRESGRRGSLLIPRGVPLAEATATLSARGAELAPELRQFIGASRRRARLGQTVTAGAAALFAGVAVVAAVFFQRAEAERTRAEQALRTATGAANTLVIELAQEFRDRGLPSDITQSILSHARTLQDSLATQFPNDPDLLASRAAGLVETGEMLLRQGNPDEARAPLEEALAIRRDLLEREPENTEWLDAVASSLEKVGEVYEVASDLEGMRAAVEEALAIRRDLVRREPDNTEWLSDVAYSLDMLASQRRMAGDTEGAGAANEEALAITRDLVAREPENTKWARYLSVGLLRIGDLRLREGDIEGARAAYEESLAIARDLVARDPENIEWANNLSASLERIGGLRLDEGDSEGAEAAFEERLAIARDVVAQDPQDARWARHLSHSLDTIGRLRLHENDTERAREAYEEALAITRGLVARDPENIEWANDLAVGLERIGDLSLRLGEIEGARTAYEEGLALARDLVTRNPENTQWPRNLSVSLRKLGELRREAGDIEGAQAAYEEALAIGRDIVVKEPGNPDFAGLLADTLYGLGDLHLHAGDTKEARAAFEEVLAITRDLVEQDPENIFLARDLSDTSSRVAELRRDAGDIEGARTALEEALAAARSAVEMAPVDPGTQMSLVNALIATGAPDEAVAAYREAQAAGVEDPTGQANNLAWRLYLAGEHEEALPIVEEWLAAHPEPAADDLYTLDTAAHVMAAAGRANEAVDLFLQSAELGGSDWRAVYEEQLAALGHAPEPGEEGFEAALRACAATGEACKLFPQ